MYKLIKSLFYETIIFPCFDHMLQTANNDTHTDFLTQLVADFLCTLSPAIRKLFVIIGKQFTCGITDAYEIQKAFNPFG